MKAVDNSLRNSVLVGLATFVTASLLVLAGWTLFEFDPALIVYAIGSILALSFTAFRLSAWVHRPPTLVLFRESLKSAANAKTLPATAIHLGKRKLTYFAANLFIAKRSLLRWGAHWPIMIGCVMAAAIVFPLIFGWVWFETPADDFTVYKVMVFGVHVRTIAVDGFEAFMIFHGLVWASIPVIIGTLMAFVRRMKDRGDQAVQTFVGDLLPLIALFSIAVSGLLLTVSYSWLKGWGHSFLANAHAMIVITTLVWIPFSKLFHVPQRSLKLAHMVYERDAVNDFPCLRCGESFAPTKQVNDLIEIEARLGYDYRLPTNEAHYQNKAHYQHVCPKCRRLMLVTAQSSRWQSSSSSDDESAPTPVTSHG